MFSHYRFHIIAVLVLISGSAFAARGSSTTRVSTMTHSSPTTLDIMGGLVTMSGTYGGSFLTGINLPISNTSPVRLGLHSGIVFGNGTGLPILASIVYHFGESRAIHPYVGGSVGPIIGLGNGSTTISNGIVSATVKNQSSFLGDGVKLAIFVRPGFRFPVSDALDLNVEMPMGGITGVFFIAPTVGAQVRL